MGTQKVQNKPGYVYHLDGNYSRSRSSDLISDSFSSKRGRNGGEKRTVIHPPEAKRLRLSRDQLTTDIAFQDLKIQQLEAKKSQSCSGSKSTTVRTLLILPVLPAGPSVNFDNLRKSLLPDKDFDALKQDSTALSSEYLPTAVASGDCDRIKEILWWFAEEPLAPPPSLQSIMAACEQYMASKIILHLCLRVAVRTDIELTDEHSTKAFEISALIQYGKSSLRETTSSVVVRFFKLLSRILDSHSEPATVHYVLLCLEAFYHELPQSLNPDLSAISLGASEYDISASCNQTRRRGTAEASSALRRCGLILNSAALHLLDLSNCQESVDTEPNMIVNNTPIGFLEFNLELLRRVARIMGNKQALVLAETVQVKIKLLKNKS